MQTLRREESMIHEENGQIIVDELRPMSDKPKMTEFTKEKWEFLNR